VDASGEDLFRHPGDPALNLGENTVTAARVLGYAHFSTMSLPVLSQDRVWRHNGEDLTEGLPSQPPVLLHQILDHDRSWRSHQPLKTASTMRRADASNTGRHCLE
jgi:hypothetical protein